MHCRDVSQSLIAEPQLLASTPHLSAMTPCCAPEPPASVLTTVGAYPMLQSYATPSSVAQSTHGQRPAAHDNRTAVTANLAAQVPAQSQHWQASGLPTVEGPSTFFQPYAMAPPVPVPVCGQLKVVDLAQLQLLMTLLPERSGACHRAAAPLLPSLP